MTELLFWTCWGLEDGPCNKRHEGLMEALHCCTSHGLEMIFRGRRTNREPFQVGADGFLYEVAPGFPRLTLTCGVGHDYWVKFGQAAYVERPTNGEG